MVNDRDRPTGGRENRASVGSPATIGNANRNRATDWLILLLPYCVLLATSGCQDSTTEGEALRPATPLAGTTLRLAVVGDPDLAGAALKLRGEWGAQTGSELDIVQFTVGELLGADSFDFDAAICPSYCLGPLAEARRIVPIPTSGLPAAHLSPSLESGDEHPWTDVFELWKQGEASWNSQFWGVPFGSPVFVCYYRPDVFERLDRQPPATWAECSELAKLLWEQEQLATLEPLAAGWRGLILLARAAASAKHPSNYSMLFDVETMAPLVDSPAMIQSLEELVATTKCGAMQRLDCDPAMVREAFWRGEAALAITYPSATTESADSPRFPVGFAELPGSKKFFNIDRRQWEPRGEGTQRVPLLATSGRVGVVTKKRPEAALELLFWLSNAQNSEQLSRLSGETTMFRKSQLDSPRAWCESSASASAATEYAGVIETTSLRSEWVLALRIPGRAAYLTALDEAVRAAVAGEKTPTAALKEAAQRWQDITEELGLESQKTAYLHSLGL